MTRPRRALTRSRLPFVVVGLVSVGSLVVLGYTASQLATQAADRQANRQVASAAAASAVVVERQLDGLIAVVEAFATRPSLVAAFTDDVRTSDSAALHRHLQELQAITPDVALVFAADPDGVLLAIQPPTPSILGHDFSFRDWYRGVIATGRPYVSEVYESAATEIGWVVAAAAPILRPGSDTVSGILVAGYTLTTLQRFVDDYAAAQGVSVTVTDQRGAVVAAPGATPARLESPRDSSGAVAPESRTGTIDRSDGRTVRASVPIASLGWALTAEVPASAALGELAGLRAGILGATVALGTVLVAGLVLLGQSLQRRATAEADLARSQAFLDSVVENIPDMVLVKDAPTLRLVQVNRAGEALLGYSRSELLGRGDDDLFPPEDAAHFTASDRDVLSGTTVLDIPVEPIATRHQGTRMLHTKKIPILGSGGIPEYLLGISEDITDRLRADADIDAARRAADEANRAKTEFLSRMSHELRTPLNAILGFGQLLRMDDLTVEQHEGVDQVLRAGHHLLELVDDVLDIARVESGQLRLSLEPVDVRTIVIEATAMVAPLAESQGVVLHDELGDDPIHARTDRQRLRQVVVNLLANAIKYNHPGGEVRLACARDGADQIQLIVSDSGIGISPADLTRLFRPFERLAADQTEVEGTGLGLALTKQLVDAMGGAVTAESVLGKGSTFRVTLPSASPPADPVEGTRLTAHRRAEVDRNRSPRTVLYIEDNPSNVQLVERVAERAGITLMVAMQGRLALQLAPDLGPDLILLDLHLPDMSGEEVLRRLKADPLTSSIPVVILSADAGLSQRARLAHHGAAAYLTKPFNIPQLVDIMDGDLPGSPTGLGQSTAETLDPTTREGLRALAGDDTGFLRDLATTYIDDSTARIANIRRAIAHGATGEIRDLAHSLVGSSAVIGAAYVESAALELERAVADGTFQTDDLASRLAHLDDVFAAAVEALHHEHPERSDGGP